MKANYLKFLLALLFLVLFSCENPASTGNSDDSDDSDDTENISDILTNTVHIVGYEYNLNDIAVAMYWKNGVATPLTDGTVDSYADSIAIYDGDVYISGTINSDSNEDIVVYWKNGVKTELTDGTTEAGGKIAILDGDVYVGGYENSDPKLWKNDIGTILPIDAGIERGEGYSIAIDGSMVYNCGNEAAMAIENKAAYWTTDTVSGTSTVTTLTDGTNRACAYDIAAENGDIHIVGYEQVSNENKARYWKNGVETSLTDDSNISTANSVSIYGTDVYIAGYETNDSGIVIAKYWKNGIATSLSDGTKQSSAKSLWVDLDDIYVIGSVQQDSGLYTAAYWKNGTPTALSDKESFVSEIWITD